MDLTHEDRQRALRIGKAIQEYLLSTGQKDARSTDVYEYLARKGLIEKDRHQGLHFRAFLGKLKNAGLLKLIPQCTHSVSEKGTNEWRFYLASDRRAVLADIKQTGKKATVVYMPKMTKEEIVQWLNEEKPNVEKLTKIDSSKLKPQEIELRKMYPRAYETWTEDEIMILERTYLATRNIDKIAELLCRQPHRVKEKLEELHIF
jgi:hypothetical protein